MISTSLSKEQEGQLRTAFGPWWANTLAPSKTGGKRCESLISFPLSNQHTGLAVAGGAVAKEATRVGVAEIAAGAKVVSEGTAPRQISNIQSIQGELT